jgi:hypothetical protein
MKTTDDQLAKIRIWARNPKVVACPRPVGLPPFRRQTFSSYEAFNAWKASYRREIARQGGVTWTPPSALKLLPALFHARP